MPAISVTLRDAYGREKRKLYGLETQVDLAAYNAVVAALMAAIAGVSDLGIVRCELVIGPYGVTDPVAGSNVDVGATFQALLEGAEGKKASHKLPGIKAAKVAADGTIDIADEDVAEYLALFETAGPLTLSDGETVDTWLKGTLDK